MDDTVTKEDQPPDFNKLDLSQLQGFSFGTQWTQDKSGGSDKRDPRPGREDRRQGPGEGLSDRRDRRVFRKPNSGAPGGSREGGPMSDRGAPVRREYANDRGAPRSRENSEGPGGRAPAYDRTPYDSPLFATTFYPDDTTFDALVKTVRASCRTIELFEIARTILGKSERFTVYLARKTDGPSAGPNGEAAPAAPARPLFLSVPDGLPFETEEAAIAHVLDKHLGLFFEASEVEIDPPKGNYQVINRCGVTGELLGPPNYHRYTQIMQQYHATKVSRMSFEAYRGRIETVRDPEVVKQWLDKMKKVTRYTWKSPAAAATAKAEPTPEKPTEPTSEIPATAEASTPPPSEPPAEAAPKESGPSFDSFDDARAHLVAQARDRIVRPVAHVRFPGRVAEALPPGEVFRAIEGALERQRRFPLETANALRGRLRREHFTIFKKGAKGVSYVCAVKRKFRVPGQVFAENIGALITFIETHPLVKAGELGEKFLGITAKEGEIPVEQREKLARTQGDLQWLVHEGYVTEFIDGCLYAPPPMADARKKEAEPEELDPENFPEPVAEAAAPEEAPVTPPPASEAAPSPSIEPTPDQI